jgi:glycine hydroxymethyltransferase
VDYARQVIKNAKKLSHELNDHGMPVKFGHKDFTESHQILLDLDKIGSDLNLRSTDLTNQLESENIIVDAVGRLGTNEMTRRGFKENDMVKVAEFITRVIVKNEISIKDEIKEYLKKFQMAYCF